MIWLGTNQDCLLHWVLGGRRYDVVVVNCVWL